MPCESAVIESVISMVLIVAAATVLVLCRGVSGASRLRNRAAEDPVHEDNLATETVDQATTHSDPHQDEFAFYDFDGDGKLNKRELTFVWGVTQGDFGVSLKCADVDNDGAINSEEWAETYKGAFYDCISEEYEKVEAQFTFANADVNPNDNCVTAHEMSDLQNHIAGSPFEEATLALDAFTVACYKCHGYEGSACLTKEQFESFGPADPEERKCWAKAMNKYRMQIDFALLDESGDEVISETEFWHFCQRMQGWAISHEEAHAIFTDTDSDKNGYVTMEEFLKAGEQHEGDGPGVFFLKLARLGKPAAVDHFPFLLAKGPLINNSTRHRNTTKSSVAAPLI